MLATQFWYFCSPWMHQTDVKMGWRHSYSGGGWAMSANVVWLFLTLTSHLPMKCFFMTREHRSDHSGVTEMKASNSFQFIFCVFWNSRLKADKDAPFWTKGSKQWKHGLMKNNKITFFPFFRIGRVWSYLNYLALSIFQ